MIQTKYGKDFSGWERKTCPTSARCSDVAMLNGSLSQGICLKEQGIRSYTIFFS